MENGEIEKEVIVETAKSLAKEVYNDVGKPILSTVGSILSLPLKLVDAALNPIKAWIDRRNANYEKTKKLLAEKLKDVKEENIVTPESYVAVPALQQLEYSYDSEELREMYANLLASAMNKEVKEYVHPSFADIIKQLSPDDAKAIEVLRWFDKCPLVNFKLKNQKDRGFHILVNNYCIDLEKIYGNKDKMSASLKNLQRLGIIDLRFDQFIHGDTIYEKITEDELFLHYKNTFENDNYRLELEKGFVELTSFGKSFCNICCSKE